MARRKIDTIIVHGAWTPSYMDSDVEDIRGWHKQRGFSDIGYHYVIRRDGEIQPGRPVELAGAHTIGHNAGSIGVCMVGGKGSGDSKFEWDANYTIEQYVALIDLIGELLKIYPQIAHIGGHRDYADRQCPGFDVRELVGDLDHYRS